MIGGGNMNSNNGDYNHEGGNKGKRERQLDQSEATANVWGLIWGLTWRLFWGLIQGLMYFLC